MVEIYTSSTSVVTSNIYSHYGIIIQRIVMMGCGHWGWSHESARLMMLLYHDEIITMFQLIVQVLCYEVQQKIF